MSFLRFIILSLGITFFAGSVVGSGEVKWVQVIKENFSKGWEKRWRVCYDGEAKVENGRLFLCGDWGRPSASVPRK